MERDFALMAAQGLNSVRTYTVPPRWLLDIAARYGLRVMIGVPWEQHITFLDRRRTVADIERRICEAVERCGGHPAVLAFSIGNEIPSGIVRWYGRRPIERMLERFYWAARREDPEALITYVNYPSTEYLDLPFLDVVAFNVYLESPATLSSYLARLGNIAGDRPLLMAEVGLDSLRNGDARQGEVLEWQISTAFAEGAAGLYVFSWTDEWYRGGQLIDDWKFGLTTLDRKPKPAMPVVAAGFQQVPVAPTTDWPFVSVVICTYNGSKTIRETLEAVRRLEYADGHYEVIVVNDGSTDATGAIASEFGVKLISVRNGGLSNARNVGWRHARGEIVAYIDDDACPDRHWLAYLVSGLLRSSYAGIGGPNISPPGDGFVAQCVDHSPGNPTHVLLDDREAEHLPGCNMAFWKKSIENVGGFDGAFRIAGDDVDFCWRLQERGLRLGFSPGAMVWHHRRGTVKTYWKQQMNYGRAEAMLERKWPEKYNVVGHLRWLGRVYSKAGSGPLLWRRQRIYHGTWGTAAFQSIYDLAPSAWAAVVAMPEWYLIVVMSAAVGTAGFFVGPLSWGWAIALAAFVASLACTICQVRQITVRTKSGGRGERLKYRLAITGLHLLQPAARLWGRLSFGLTPWRRRGKMPFAPPWKRTVALWREEWRSAEDRLKDMEGVLRDYGTIVSRGGNFDPWDLEVRGGFLSHARVLMTIEEHGQGKQLVRLKVWPAGWHWLLLAIPGLIGVELLNLDRTAWLLALGVVALLATRALYEYCTAAGVAFRAFAVSSRGRRLASPPKIFDGAAARAATSDGMGGRLLGMVLSRLARSASNGSSSGATRPDAARTPESPGPT